MNQYGQKPINPDSGMEQLQSAMMDKPITVDEMQVKQKLQKPQQQQGGMGIGNMGKSIAGWFG